MKNPKLDILPRYAGNPKPEIRNPKEIQERENPKSKTAERGVLNFGIRFLIFFRISDFGFRISRVAGRISDFGFRIFILGMCLLTTACQQEMARQPSYRPLEKAEFFADGRASRPIVEGTVPWRGREPGEPSLLVHRRSPEYTDAARAAALIANPVAGTLGALPSLLGPAAADFVSVSPVAIDRKALERGRDRFNIYCAVCHDALGTGNGKIVERGYLPPPNYHLDYSRGFERRGQKILLREVPIGYFYDVITRGFGGMPDYASQIPPEDRWKIAAYVRVLQRSQWMPLKDLPAQERDKIRAELTSREEAK